MEELKLNAKTQKDIEYTIRMITEGVAIAMKDAPMKDADGTPLSDLATSRASIIALKAYLGVLASILIDRGVMTVDEYGDAMLGSLMGELEALRVELVDQMGNPVTVQ